MGKIPRSEDRKAVEWSWFYVSGQDNDKKETHVQCCLCMDEHDKCLPNGLIAYVDSQGGTSNSGMKKHLKSHKIGKNVIGPIRHSIEANQGRLTLNGGIQRSKAQRLHDIAYWFATRSIPRVEIENLQFLAAFRECVPEGISPYLLGQEIAKISEERTRQICHLLSSGPTYLETDGWKSYGREFYNILVNGFYYSCVEVTDKKMDKISVTKLLELEIDKFEGTSKSHIMSLTTDNANGVSAPSRTIADQRGYLNTRCDCHGFSLAFRKTCNSVVSVKRILVEVDLVTKTFLGTKDLRKELKESQVRHKVRPKRVRKIPTIRWSGRIEANMMLSKLSPYIREALLAHPVRVKDARKLDTRLKEDDLIESSDESEDESGGEEIGDLIDITEEQEETLFRGKFSDEEYNALLDSFELVNKGYVCWDQEDEEFLSLCNKYFFSYCNSWVKRMQSHNFCAWEMYLLWIEIHQKSEEMNTKVSSIGESEIKYGTKDSIVDDIKDLWRVLINELKLRRGQMNDSLLCLCGVFNPFVASNSFSNWNEEIAYFLGMKISEKIDENKAKFGKGVRIYLNLINSKDNYGEFQILLQKQWLLYKSNSYQWKYDFTKKDSNIFEFWRQQICSFDIPDLAKLAYNVLRIIVSNAGVERSFKTEKQVFQPERSTMTVENVHHELNLRHNHHLIGNPQFSLYNHANKRIDESGLNAGVVIPSKNVYATSALDHAAREKEFVDLSTVILKGNLSVSLQPKGTRSEVLRQHREKEETLGQISDQIVTRGRFQQSVQEKQAQAKTPENPKRKRDSHVNDTRKVPREWFDRDLSKGPVYSCRECHRQTNKEHLMDDLMPSEDENGKDTLWICAHCNQEKIEIE